MSTVPCTLRGVVRGSTIVLDTDPGLPDGQPVTLTVYTEGLAENSGRLESKSKQFLDLLEGARSLEAGEGLRRSFGSCADEAADLDEFLALSRNLRRRFHRELEP